jgi:redox-sensitive bicupin YhaK (pirin superfamily)
MSDLEASPTLDACPCEAAAAPLLEATPARRTDIGGLPVRRLLPRSRRRLVGPWCFLDSFGPIRFTAGKPMDVPPHPHIGLQTVSWLLEGEVLHNDSLGQTGIARPGVLNLMTAGGGIAHSEETPPGSSGLLQGVQLWVALPDARRNVAPSFERHEQLPIVSLPGGEATLFVGRLGEGRSPATVFSPIVGADLSAKARSRLVVPVEPAFEHAVVLLRGTATLDEQSLAADTLYYLGTGRCELSLLSGDDDARLLLIGGAPLGETILMWWNFVARTSDEIAEAREDWESGRRFGEVKAYRGERLSAPPLVARPVRDPRT